MQAGKSLAILSRPWNQVAALGALEFLRYGSNRRRSSVHQSAFSAMRDQTNSSGRVLLRSWPSVLAVNTTFQSIQVDMAQLIIMAINADLPIPLPLATLTRWG